MDKYKYKAEGVWVHALEPDGIFNAKEIAAVKKNWTKYAEETLDVFSFDEAYEKLVNHTENVEAEVSPMWREWASKNNTVVNVDLDLSTTLDNQTHGIKDSSTAVTEINRLYPGALMCCDTPERTVAFLVACYADHHGIGIDDRMFLMSRVMAYVELQMRLAFICKHTTKVWRPSDYELDKGMATDKPSVSRIPHPDHPSMPSGHSTVGFATLKAIQFWCNGNVSKDFEQLCNDVGEARITIGIHWHVDHEAARRNVDEFNEMVLGVFDLKTIE